MASSVAASTSALKYKSCKKCKSNLVDGIKCKNCRNHYHLSCAKLCNSIKFINNDTIICCEPVDVDTAFFDAMENLSTEDKKVDINIFNYIIKQKDIIIDELREKIKILNDQLVLNEKLGATEEKEVHIDKKFENIKTYADKTMEYKHKNISEVPNISRSNVPKSKSTVTREQVGVALMEQETRIKCNDYINLTKDDENLIKSNENNQWKKVFHKKRKHPVIVGNNSNIEINGKAIKGVPKTTALHVYRVDRSMTVNDLKDLLKVHFPEVTCEAMTPKHPELYSSFKVNIFEENYSKAMDATKWPTGAYVQRFLQLRKREDTQTR